MSHHRRTVTAEGAPAAVGPYRHAVVAGGLLFCSGQTPLDPTTNELVDGPLGAQAHPLPAEPRRGLRRRRRVAGRRRAADRLPRRPGRFAEVNEAYGAFFGDDPPARTTIGVAALPLGAQVEIDAIVALPD